MTTDWQAVVAKEADLDPQLIEHAQTCDEKFCVNFKKLLFYAAKERRGHSGFEAVQDV